jgi:hypothetical protein
MKLTDLVNLVDLIDLIDSVGSVGSVDLGFSLATQLSMNVD